MQGAEIELKAALPPADLNRIGRSLARRATAGGTRFLVTRYFDTSDRVLEAAGIAWRLRSSPGTPVIQSIKAGRKALGGFQSSEECEAVIGGTRPDLGAIPDSALSARLRALIAGRPLVPKFETRVRRRICRLAVPGGEVEVAIDRGQIRAGRRREPICEIEFELKAGSPEILFALASQWLGRAPARLVLPNKAERGAALASGTPLAPAVLSSKPIDARRGLPAGERFEQHLSRFAEAVAANLHLTLSAGEPEGPHQLRVALRRLRTALRLHRPILDRGLADDLSIAARDMGRIVSPLRDADVVAGGLLIPRADPMLAAALGQWQEEVRVAVRQQLREAAATGLAIRLLSLAVLGGWQRPGRRHRLLLPHEEVVRPGIERLWARIAHAGNRLAGLSPEARHQFRKDLKKFRYALEQISSDATPTGLGMRLKRLLEDLGNLNDLAVLEGFAPDLGPEANAALAKLKAGLPHASTARRDQLLGRACRHWQALAALSPPGEWLALSGPPPSALAEPNR